MSNAYGREYDKPQPFPTDLALRIARKACAMADKFEEQCLDTMIRDARRALQRGADPAQIVRQMEL